MLDDYDTEELLQTALTQKDQLIHFAISFQQMMMLYESAVKCVTTQLDILKEDFRVKGVHIPIESVSGRVKQPMSIAEKLDRYGYETSVESMMANLNDIAGVRVRCKYISDVYTVRDTLLSRENITLVKEKDYIKEPKENGYRSLHLIVEVPVILTDKTEMVRCEIQIRTLSMDSWAALEHHMRYKRGSEGDAQTDAELCQCAELAFASDVKMQQIAERLGIFDEKETRLDISRFLGV